MMASMLLMGLALAADPTSTGTEESVAEPVTEPAPLTVETMAHTDVVATVRALQAELKAQRAELEVLREQARETLDTGTPAGNGPLIIAEGERSDTRVAIGQDVHVRGHVVGDITAIGSDIRVFPTGIIDGNAVAVGGSVIIVDGGQVSGDRVTLRRDDLTGGLTASSWPGVWAGLARRLALLLSFMGAGVLTIGLFPDRVARVAERVSDRPVASLTVGTLGTIGLLVGAVVFAITLIGLPITFVLMALFGMTWLLGFVGLCQAVGDRLPTQQKVHGRWLAFLGGSLLVAFLGSLPALGVVVIALISMLGMGAAFTTRLGTR